MVILGPFCILPTNGFKVRIGVGEVNPRSVPRGNFIGERCVKLGDRLANQLSEWSDGNKWGKGVVKSN